MEVAFRNQPVCMHWYEERGKAMVYGGGIVVTILVIILILWLLGAI
jgi:hypothetical protein